MNDHLLKLSDLKNISYHCSRYFAVLIFLLVLSACRSDADKPENAAKESEAGGGQTAGPTAPDYSVLVGRWLRPDGGYVIEIQNPRTINVSQALAAQKDGQIQIFIELRDVGYPGATYTLTYDKGNDVLNGLYYQPAAGQTFEVQFVRKE